MTSASARVQSAIVANERALGRARAGLVDAVAGFYALKAAIGAPVREAMLFESAMADVKKVVDFPTPEAFEAFKQELLGLSRVVPESVNGLAAIAAAAGQAGIAGDDLVRFTEAAAKVGTAFDTTADETGASLAKLKTGLGLSIEEVVLLSDAMNHLSNSQASTAAEIQDVVLNSAATAKRFGFTAEQTAAFGSAMIAAGAASNVATTSFRNMGRALTRGDSATKRQVGAYAQLGLNAREVAAAMQQDASGTTLDVLERISKLAPEIQAAVSSDLFGNEARALGPLLTNLDLIRETLGLVAEQTEYAGSAFREFDVRAGTFENKVQTFNNVVSALKIAIGDALIPVLTDLIKTISPAITKLAELVAAYPEITATVLSAAAGLIGFRVAAATLKFVGLIGKGGALHLMAVGLKAIGAAGTPVAGFLETLKMRATLATGATGKSPGFLAKLGDALLVLGRTFAKPVAAIGRLLPLLARFSLVGGAVAAVGWFIYQNWKGLVAFFQGVGEGFQEGLAPIGEAFDELKTAVSEAIEPLQPIFDAFGAGFQAVFAPLAPLLAPVAGAFKAIWDALTGMVGPIDASEEQWAGWGRTMSGAVVGAITTVINLIKGIVEWIGKAIAGAVELATALGNLAGGAWDGAVGAVGGAVSGVGDFLGGAINSLTGGDQSGHRAGGGPVWPGGSYLVGEQEPEIFRPRQAGRITPLSDLGGGQVTIGDIYVQGASNPEATARRVMEVLSDEVAEALRGAHFDTGARDY